MSRKCTSCAVQFEFTPEDIAFFKKVSPRFGSKTCSIPPPNLCSECRNVRRMAWRNDRSFYMRKCDLSGERMVAIYPPDTPFPVYHPKNWYSDKWDPMDYGQDLDLSRSFFEQWHELMQKVPRLGVDIVNCENSYYCNYCGDDKNCYLDIAGEGNEDCFYNLFTKFSKDCVDCTFVYDSTLCYECVNSYNCYDCRYSMYLENCSNLEFCFDCKGCKDCLFSINLRNKQYYIHNKPHSKEEYERKREELMLGSASSVQRLSSQWLQQRIERGVYRDMYNLSCEHCDGNNIKNSKNCQSVYNAVNCEDCKYLYDVLDAKDCQDLNYSLYKPEASYNLISTLQMHYSACNMASHYCSGVFYCDLTNNSQNLFGCIGLNQKKYCILNKQYSQQEYEDLVPQLIEHMTQLGEWGEFFPITMSPCAYNETVAQEYFPLTQEEALAVGYKWKNESQQREAGAAVHGPDHISDAAADICETALNCTECSKAYKIVKQELSFYQKQGIPLPAKCS
ncbi:MAG: hypothetical protein KDD66_17575, partial [Bdellovibrionales bacterium]|nr:hypothetical protein [Bdellovibrionales bacterium]